MTIPRVVFPAVAAAVAAAAVSAAAGVLVGSRLHSHTGTFPRELICFLSFSALFSCHRSLLLRGAGVDADDDADDNGVEPDAVVIVADVIPPETTNSD